jgi:AcrR family transcriptional regulator
VNDDCSHGLSTAPSGGAATFAAGHGDVYRAVLVSAVAEPAPGGTNRRRIGVTAASRGDRTRRRLLDAGEQVFAAKGFHGARVDDIVKLADTSHGTFYLYFANKDDLFHGLAREVAADMLAHAGTLGVVTPDDDGRAALRVWLAGFTDRYERHAAVIRAWTEAETAGDAVAREGERLLESFATTLSSAIARTSPADAQQATVAGAALLAMIERLNYYVLTGQVALERDEMLDTLATVTHAAIFGA